jgi:hypothetical protein
MAGRSTRSLDGMRGPSRIALTLALAAVVVCSTADAQADTDALLDSFAAELKLARSMPLGTYHANPPSAEPLLGLTRRRVFGALGTPDSCYEITAAKCQTVRSWIYFYQPHNPKDHIYGGGWSLHFEIVDDRVKRAYWMLNK